MGRHFWQDCKKENSRLVEAREQKGRLVEDKRAGPGESHFKQRSKYAFEEDRGDQIR